MYEDTSNKQVPIHLSNSTHPTTQNKKS